MNNAGRIIDKPVMETSCEEWESILATNATGAFLHSRGALTYKQQVSLEGESDISVGFGHK